MDYKVIRRFRDKYTREIYLPGDIFESDEAERIEDLLSRGLIEQTSNTEPDYNNFTKEEIIALLDERGIEYNARQTKVALIALLGGE